MAGLNKAETKTIRTAMMILKDAAENGYNPDREDQPEASMLRMLASELSFIVRDKGTAL